MTQLDPQAKNTTNLNGDYDTLNYSLIADVASHAISMLVLKAAVSTNTMATTATNFKKNANA